MEIIAFEKKTFDTISERFEMFVKRMDGICLKHNKQASKWLDNMEVCQLLNISKRTLQTYRDNGTLPYSRINHKMFYKSSDIEKVFNQAQKQVA